MDRCNICDWDLGVYFTLYGLMPNIVAISACLLGKQCRYDASDNKNETLLEKLKGNILVPFCPEDDAFGTPRPTMDLVGTEKVYGAISNLSGENLSLPILDYAKDFFEQHTQIDLFIGKDRSPSCGVCSARLYDEEKNLLSSTVSGLMAQEAKRRNIPCIDAEKYGETT